MGQRGRREAAVRVDVDPPVSQPLDAPATSASRPPASMEATATLGQGEAMMPPTIPDMGGRPGAGIAAAGEESTAAYDFFTPRSRGNGMATQNNWMGVVEGLPRWMSRLGSYLAVGHDQLAPSPLTGETPPGGRSFVLRSPQRARPLTLPRPSSPPSSSVPAEAIQQEVQRQLSGIRVLLEESEGRNQQLQRELDEVRRSRDALRAVPAGCWVIPRQFHQALEGNQVLAGYWVIRQQFHQASEGNQVILLQLPWVQLVTSAMLERYENLLYYDPVFYDHCLEAALTKGTGTGAAEALKAGTTSLTQLPDHKGGAEASLRFNDWLEITTTAMTDVSEKSGQWWNAVLMVVRAAYNRWLAASHLERLTISPEGMDGLCGDPWSRMNARACTMLLGAMSPEIKGDMVAQQLTQRAPAMLFRLFVWFQPGGSAERQEVLKRLQSPQDYLVGDSAEAILAEVRSWPRWLSRCRMMGMTPPDPLVMSRGLQALTAKPINASTDASFRTSMLRSTYRLDGQPTLEQVQGYHKHLQAELEAIVGSQRTMSLPTAGAALRAVDGTSPTTSPKGPKGREKSQELCRYFSKPSGCKRGDRCVYSHSMSGMDKDVRSRKCLKCGSESHRARDCNVGKPGQRPSHTDKPQPPTATPTRSLATMSTATSMGSAPVQGTPWTLETLIQAAQHVITSPSPQEGDSSPEKTKAEVRVLSLRDVRVSAMDRSTTALLDSGATHCLRNAYDEKEWLEADEVVVQLAGNNSLTMRLSAGGSLLMPPRIPATSSTTRDLGGQTIVPLGELVKTLGYSLDWSQRGCFLIDPDGVSRSLGVCGGCPLLKEAEALALISRLEDRKREMLENATTATQDTVEATEMMMNKSWKTYLRSYVADGGMEAGLRAIRDCPMLSELPGNCVDGLVQGDVMKDGWKVFKDIEHLTRSQRRRLWSARRWIIHLYAGTPGHFQMYQLDEGDTVVVELDLQRNRGHDVERTSTWRWLMWGAMQGRIEAIVGGPPGRARLGTERRGAVEWDNKSLKAVTKMMRLHVVAEEGRNLNARGADRGRPVAFMMEHPSQDARAQGARRRSLWETSMWEAFKEEYDMTEVKFDQRATGATGSSPTTLGTNIYYLQGLHGEGEGGSDHEEQRDLSGVWSSGLVKAVVLALSFWRRLPATTPRLCPMSPAQWKRHVDSNHLDYNRECLTCVLSRGTGRRHARVHHPEMFSLTVDIAGPVKPGLDVTSKGTQGKGLRYLLVGKYTLPKEFVKSYSGKKPPDDDGLLDPLDVEDTSSKPNQSEELETPSLLPPREEGESGAQGDQPDQNEELGTPSLLPPREEWDPFVIEDVPGEQGPPTTEDVPGEQGQDDEHDQGVSSTDFIGATTQQKEGMKDYECSEYEPSVVGEDMNEAADDESPGHPSQEGPRVCRPDCEAPESTVLMFARALKSNAGVDVKAAIQDIVLYLDSHGLPVYRFHADRGECFSHNIRGWLRDRHIKATWSEAGTPPRKRASRGSSTMDQRSNKDSVAGKLATYFFVAYGGGVSSSPPASQGVWVEVQAHGPIWSTGLGEREGVWGHVVSVPSAEAKKGHFLHTFHIKARLYDPGPPLDELEVPEPPKPKRKLPVKTPSEQVEMRAMSLSQEEVELYAITKAQLIMEDWDPEQARNLIGELAEAEFFEEKKFGVYRHGGSVGWMKGLPDYPDLGRLMAKLVLHHCPEATFTSIMVSTNFDRGYHKDTNNDSLTCNYVVPIKAPQRGGALWVELRPGDVVTGEVLQRQDPQGRVHYGQVYDMKEGQHVEFDPRRAHEVLPWVGTRINLVAYTPNSLGKLSYEDVKNLEDHGFPTPLSQLPEYFVRDQKEAKCVEKLEVQEENAGNSDGDASLSDDDWEMFVEAERGKVKVGSSTKGSRPQRQPRMNKTEVTYTKNVEMILSDLSEPLKVTYTVDPKEVASGNSRACYVAAKERSRRWQVALIDVVAAFILTPIGESARAPMLWSSYRDRTLAKMVTPSGWRFKQGRTVTCWWIATDAAGELKALIIIYVDDILIIGMENAVMEVATLVQGVWATSPLTFLRPGNPLRFLGMELTVTDDESMILVGQQAYIEELCRNHGVTRSDKIPVAKEAASFSVVDADLEPDESGIAQAQRITGELLWISQKTRPDLSYGCSLLSSLTLKAPYRAVEVGMKMIRYLQGTKEWKMAFQATDKILTMYPDAAFAPESAKSHTGWMVVWGKNPIAWRSARQSTIALSTAEAELTAILEGAIALLGIESLLVDLVEEVEEKKVGSDSVSALTISAGNGSWRTRHLRLKSAWLEEMIAARAIDGFHVPGLVQPADLLTKALAGQRIRDLLHLWSMVGDGIPQKCAVVKSKAVVSEKVRVATICCLMVTMAAGQSEREPRISIDWDMAGIFMVLLMVLGSLVIWEGLKWIVAELSQEWLPGASQRKLRKLRKLRDATTLAIERELERMSTAGGTEPTVDPRYGSNSKEILNLAAVYHETYDTPKAVIRGR
ncbi:unnamed protein product [Symbiodinium sp. CCMP2592]|nr:unnamed protein product [Symbiodinium sp. CCMP2592]